MKQEPPILGIAAAAVLLVGGAFILFMAAIPRFRRNARWGRRGRGPVMSILSIISWGLAFSVTSSAWLLEQLGIAGFSDKLIFWLSVFGFLTVMLCSIRDSRRQDSADVANHLPDPTSPSVTPPAGAGGAPSVDADH